MLRWFLAWWRGEDLSAAWWRERQRFEMSRGLEQSCIDWDAMKREAFKR